MNRVMIFFFFCLNLSAKPYLDQKQCLLEFSMLAEGRSYDDMVALAKRLKKRDLQCLYRASEHSGAPDINFFEPATDTMAVLFGKNSMPFANTFEKHLFSSRARRTATDVDGIYGYNFHRGMRFTGPGFFKVSKLDDQILIDFSADFENEITSHDLQAMRGSKVSLPKNNAANAFFGGRTKDYCRRLIYDEKNQRDIAVVCQGHRNFLGCRPAFIWDILIRQW